MNTQANSTEVMKVFIPFLKATTQVLEELTQEMFIKKNIYPFQGNITVGDIKVEIGVVGDIQTRVIFDFPKIFARDLAAIMMALPEEEEITDELVVEATQELGNMISGNALGFLEEKNIHCDITPPIIYMIKERDMSISNTASLGVIEFTSNIGDFNIYVVINETDHHESNLYILNLGLSEEANHLISRSFIPKGIGIIGANDIKHIHHFMNQYAPSVITINTQDIEPQNILKELENIPHPETISLILFGDEELPLSIFFKNVIHSPYIEDPYEMLETMKNLIASIKIPIYVQRKPLSIKIPDNIKKMNFFEVLTKTQELEDIPIAQISLENIIIDISNHQDINFPEGKNLTQNIYLLLNNQKVPIIKAQLGKTMQNGTSVQIILHHILETELHKITEFIYYLLSYIE